MLVHYLVHQKLIYYCVLTIIKNNIYKLKINDNKKQPVVALERPVEQLAPDALSQFQQSHREQLCRRPGMSGRASCTWTPTLTAVLLWQIAVKFIPSLPPKRKLSCYTHLCPGPAGTQFPSSVL